MRKLVSRRAGFWRTDAAWAMSCLAGLFLGFFRAPWAFQVNWQNDEGCYLKYAALLSGIDPGQSCYTVAFHAPGVALAWWPAGLLAQVGAWFTGHDARDWLIPLAALTSFASLGVALWALAQIFAQRGIPRPRLWAAAVTLASQVLYYSIQWPLLAHATEFAVATLLLLALTRGKAGLALLAAGWLTLIRFNDVPAVLLPWGLLWTASRARKSQPPIGWMAALSALALGGVAWVALFRGYGPSTLTFLLGGLTWENLVQFLGNDRYGLIWLSPLWLVTLLWGTACARQLDATARFALVWAWVEFLVCTAWGGSGGTFGIRYLIGSYAAIIWVGLALLKRYPRARRGYGTALGLSALWMTWLIYAHRSAPPFLSEMRLVPQTGREQDLGIPRFFFHALVGAFDLRTWLELVRANVLQGVPALSVFLNTWRAPFMREFNPLFLIVQPALGVLATATAGATAFLAVRVFQSARERGVRLGFRHWKTPAIAALVFLLCFRARWAFNLNPESLEACYLRLTSNVLGWNSQSLCQTFAAPPLAPGAPWLWTPVAMLGAGLAHWAGESRASGAIPLIALTSFVLWGYSLSLIHRFLRANARVPATPGFAAALLLSTPLLYFTTHLALLPPAWEFALAMLCLVSLQEARFGRAMLAALGVVWVQPESFWIGGIVLAALLARPRNARSSPRGWGEASATLLGTLTAGAYALSQLAERPPASPPVIPALFGGDPGLFWTLPLFLTLFLSGIWRWRELSARGRVALAWVAFAAGASLATGRFALPWVQTSAVGAYAAALLVLEQGALAPSARPALRTLAIVNAFTMTALLVYALNSGWNLWTHAPLQQWPLSTLALSIPGVPTGPASVLGLAGFPLALLALASFIALLLCTKEFLRGRR